VPVIGAGQNPVVEIVCLALTLFEVTLIIVILESWFPVSSASPAAGFFSILHRVTEPVLGPLRRMVPAMGGFDFSPMIAFFGIFLLQRVFLCRGGIL
jgi:YggT family protein